MARHRRLLFTAVPVLVVLAALAGGSDQADVAEALLYTAPGALLLLPLAFGRYLGETRIEGLLRARARPPVASRRVVFWPAQGFPRGGGLLASSLAERGPPVRLMHHG